MEKIGHKALEEIVEGCRSFDRTSQRKLYDLLFQNVLNSISFHNYLSTEEEEDLVQESFIKIFNNIDKYDFTKSSIFTWSSIIAKRLTINYLISKKNIVNKELSEVSEKFFVEINFKDEMEIQLILDSIKRLPDKYKDVFEMAVIHGMEHKKISKNLGISTSSSRVYLTRAKSLLREDMTKFGIKL